MRRDEEEQSGFGSPCLLRKVNGDRVLAIAYSLSIEYHREGTKFDDADQNPIRFLSIGLLSAHVLGRHTS